MERTEPKTTSAGSAQETSVRSSKVRQVLQELWEANRGTIAERIAAIRSAYDLLSGAGLDASTREKAISAAHKLAGVLGTFGFPRGSELALQTQLLLEVDGPVVPAEIARLKAMLDELAVIVTTQSLP